MANFLVMEDFNSVMFVLLLVPFLLIIFKIFKKHLISTSSKLPPGPTPWPLIGNIPQLGNMPHVSLAKFAQIYGPIMTFKLGHKPLIVASSPSIAMEILKKQDLILSGRDIPRAFPYSRKELNQISIGWTEECNETSKYLKSLCRAELFSGKALTSQESLRATKVIEMVDSLKAKEGQVINIGQVAFATTFSFLGNILLSKNLINLEEGIEKNSAKALLRRVIDIVSVPNLADLYPALSELDLQGIRKKAKSLWQQIWSIWEPIVEEKRRSIPGNKDNYQDFVDILVGQHFTNDKIHQILMELFIAGTDTTTSTIEWMMAELINNPRLMNILREELEKRIDQDSPIKESQLHDLPYLQACLKETLRLHPAAPLLLPRRALETCQVMNYTIPKNAQVLVNVWAIGRDPTIWEEPLAFKPERFLDSSIDFKGNDFEFLPFGSGRRICPGYSFAARLIPLVIASLVQYFEWSLPKEEETNMLDMKEKFGLTLQKEQPLLLIPNIRK